MQKHTFLQPAPVLLQSPSVTLNRNQCTNLINLQEARRNHRSRVKSSDTTNQQLFNRLKIKSEITQLEKCWAKIKRNKDIVASANVSSSNLNNNFKAFDKTDSKTLIPRTKIFLSHKKKNFQEKQIHDKYEEETVETTIYSLHLKFKTNNNNQSNKHIQSVYVESNVDDRLADTKVPQSKQACNIQTYLTRLRGVPKAHQKAKQNLQIQNILFLQRS